MVGERGNSGHVLVTVALLMVVLVGFLAMSVDIGVGYSARTSAQKAVDAGALAGAFTFINSPLANQPSVADSRARATTQINAAILDSSIQPGDIDVFVDTVNRRVTVNASYTQGTFFAEVMGFNVMDVAVSAVAEASGQGSASSCPKPWFIPNTILSDLPPCDACAAGEVMIDPASGELTDWATTELALAPLKSLKPQRPAEALEPSQFYAIKIGGTGAAIYRANIATCNPAGVFCSDLYPVETGNMVGPTNQGVADLTQAGDVWCGYSGEGVPQFGPGGCLARYDTSPQLVAAPVWDTCNYMFNGEPFCPGNIFPAGQHGGEVQIPVLGFALLFVEGFQPPDNVMARLLGAFGCGTGGGSTGEFGPFSVPIRLVRVPEEGG